MEKFLPRKREGPSLISRTDTEEPGVVVHTSSCSTWRGRERRSSKASYVASSKFSDKPCLNKARGLAFEESHPSLASGVHMQIYENPQRHQQKAAAFLRLASFSVVVYFLGQGFLEVSYSIPPFPARLGIEEQSQCHLSNYFELERLVWI